MRYARRQQGPTKAGGQPDQRLTRARPAQGSESPALASSWPGLMRRATQLLLLCSLPTTVCLCVLVPGPLLGCLRVLVATAVQPDGGPGERNTSNQRQFEQLEGSSWV
ncbi:hypothetical protein GQ53DRAFT_225693 [Thozetella sp. PMI_491]|nr:hypothetical protein GQ53DRAFT_225693 [Thozetella sp. PMI_491]